MSSKSDWLVCFLMMAILPCAAWDGNRPEVSRKTLDQPTEIQGYPCAKGYAFFYADGSLNQCSVSRDTIFGEARVPAGSLINLLPDGKPRYAMLQHDAPLHGITCRGGSWLGPGEGAASSFYPTGKLKECFLAGDQEVQGVPCAAGGFLGASASFHENGKLHSCKLSKDFANLKKGQVISQAQ